MKIGDEFFSKNWLGNSDEYIIIESYIQNIFIKTLQQLNNDVENWSLPFFKVYFFEGDKELNGNPIFSAKNNIERYIIKVVIDEDSDSIKTWKDKFDDLPLYTAYLNSQYISEIEPFFKQVIETKNI